MTLASHRRALAGGLLAALLLASCRPGTPASNRPPAHPADRTAPRPVRLASAELRPMERSIAVTGTLAARESATLSAKVPGRLVLLAVDLGSRVQAGDVIGQIEPRDYELKVQQAAAALAQARAALGLPLDADSDAVELTTVSSVKQAQAVLDEATKNRDRVRRLSQSGIASSSELDTVEAAFSVAFARYQVALEDARARLATLAQRRAESEIARKQLADSTITAPFAGAIQARLANTGEYLATGTPVVRLVQTDPLRLRLEIPEREASLVRTGQTVRLTVEGLEGVYRGQLARLSPALDAQSRMLLVEADVPNPGDLRPGLFARARIVVNPVESGLSVPTNAVVTFAGIEKVLLVDAGKALEKNITTGRRGSNWIEVVEGLTNGALVIEDPGPLRTGQPVVAELPASTGNGPPVVTGSTAATATPLGEDFGELSRAASKGAEPNGSPAGPTGNTPGGSEPQPR